MRNGTCPLMFLGRVYKKETLVVIAPSDFNKFDVIMYEFYIKSINNYFKFIN